MNSCIYEGTVRHRRFGPVPHEFTMPLFMMYLDLDEVPTLFDDRWLWSAKGPAFAWFRAADYLGCGETDLAEAVRTEAERLTGRRPTGPIRMLTHLRYMGFVMNPVTFYYCFRGDGVGDGGGAEVGGGLEVGGSLQVILAEITNTPWKERHVYALRAAEPAGTPARQSHRFDKAFHVSPFMPMAQEYVWHFSEPGDLLSVHMENHAAPPTPESAARAERASSGEDATKAESLAKVFDASLRLRRSEITGASLARVLVRFPLMTARVAAGIYWHALKLRLKGTPYIAHPHGAVS